MNKHVVRKHPVCNEALGTLVERRSLFNSTHYLTEVT